MKLSAINNILLLAKRFVFIILFYIIFRLIFLAFNAGYYNNLSTGEIFLIFANGLRFDISAIVWTNSLFIFLHVLPGNFKNNTIYQKMLKFLFFTINGFAVLINTADAKFFEFEEKRTTSDIFSPEWLGGDFIALLPRFVIDFWYVPLLFIVMLIGLWRFYPKLNNTKIFKGYSLRMFLSEILIFIIVSGVAVIGARGGFALKPIAVVTAAKYTKPRNIPLIVNSTFTIIRTINKGDLKRYSYFDESIKHAFFNPVKKYESKASGKKTNVVVIILESFGKEYIGELNNNEGYTPFLDSLIRNGLSFKYAFANGKRSIEAMPSIIAGIPALMDNAFITSKYSINKINSLASILRSEGYHTSFFHGGTNGTMSFDIFAKVAGIEHYYGRSDYNNENDYDGHWGIYDEPFMQYFAKQLNSVKKPFFTSIFTLSSHHPYTIPEKYKGKFKKGKLINVESVAYTDFALKRFFNTVSKYDWYKNTLFVLTADHTAQAYSDYYKTRTGMYAVPLVFFHPQDSCLAKQPEGVAQQIDIMPSVLDYLDYQKSFYTFGNSVFSDKNRFAINYINGIYQYISDKYVIHFDGRKVVGVYDFENDVMLEHNLTKKINDEIEFHINRLKAIIQTYNADLIDNKMMAE